MRTSKPQTVGDILSKFNPLEDKYISREFQAYGIYLAEQLGDMRHKSLYIKLAKEVPRPILEKTLSFVKGAGKVRNRARLFMWKLKKLRDERAKRVKGHYFSNKSSRKKR